MDDSVISHPPRSKSGHLFKKVQDTTGNALDDGSKKKKTHERMAKVPSRKKQLQSSIEKYDEQQGRIIAEAFLAKLFAGISSIKAAYVQLQFAQSPYDADSIQSADQVVVSELKDLSELKQSYLKKQVNVESPETTLLLAEIKEQKCLLKTYEITCKQLDSQLKLSDQKIMLLKEKLAEAIKENKSFEKKINASGQLTMADNIHFSDLNLSHFTQHLHQAVKSIQSFVRLLIREMESVDWDLDNAAMSIVPGVSFWKSSHKCFAFESFVCRQMFDCFNHPYFSIRNVIHEEKEQQRRLLFNRFLELKPVKPADYLARKPKSLFAAFCQSKYSRLMHPKLEASLFGNIDARNSVDSGCFPETPFFSAFTEMAKCVWLLHCLALSFQPEVSVFQVSKGSPFSETYMEALSDEAFLIADDGGARVAFMVVPGFRIGKTVIQSQVYLSAVVDLGL